MFTAHPNIKTPPDDTIIWRYINLEKLLAMLCRKKLFLCRLDKLSDPWEGAWPQPVLEAISKNWPDSNARGFRYTTEVMKVCFFVNCWHASAHESAALWGLYANTSGIAIKSTIGKLKSSISSSEDFFIGEVSYLDFESDSIGELNVLTPPFLKRKSFEHEKEIRVLSWQMPMDNGSIDFSLAKPSLSLDLDPLKLADEILLSPNATDWLLPSLLRLLELFGLSNVKAHKSSLYAKHVY